MGELETRGPILPPFDLNHPNVAKHSPEVTGRILIKSMCERLGWPSLAGKRLLDFGCGVRLTRAIFNLEIEVGLYAGVDVNAAAISWLKENVQDSRFQFTHLDMLNAMYNPTGRPYSADELCTMGFADFDAACMFSVITHQDPREAELIFSMLRRCADRLYFTAFIDETVNDFYEEDPPNPRRVCIYPRALIEELLARTHWHINAIYPKSPDILFQQTAFVCSSAQ